MEKLANIWFEKGQSDAFYDQLTELMVDSGIYGTMETIGFKMWRLPIKSVDRTGEGMAYCDFSSV